MDKKIIWCWIIMSVVATGLSFAFYAGLIWFAAKMLSAMPGGH